ncbi:MAG: hypothetical protein A2Y97_12340 [Nitrospirae bacterium RBG_13_39_12]|nr:MAG: hypothetical protein A2Y97_12340 [Nitrospirae bacterium RBG_13_39_12]
MFIFSCHSRNPVPKAFGIREVGSPQRLAEERILPERFRTDPRQSGDKSRNDGNLELWQRPQGIIIINYEIELKNVTRRKT